MIIHDLKKEILKNKIENPRTDYSSNLLVTSFGRNGGLYEVNTNKKNYQKIITGDFKGIVKDKYGYALVAHDYINFLDNDLQLYRQIQFDNEYMDMHGIDYNNGFYYIVDVTTNTIKIISEDSLKIEDELCLSEKNNDIHHMNDICIINNDLLVSMFSISNNSDWKTNKDGAIVAFDKNTLQFSKVIANELNWPHNIKLINGEIYFCESRECNLSNTFEEMAKFNGFTRGLDFDDNLFYVGQSAWNFNRYLPPKKINNISLDSGIYVYNPELRCSKFIEMPVDNIYAILCI